MMTLRNLGGFLAVAWLIAAVANAQPRLPPVRVTELPGPVEKPVAPGDVQLDHQSIEQLIEYITRLKEQRKGLQILEAKAVNLLKQRLKEANDRAAQLEGKRIGVPGALSPAAAGGEKEPIKVGILHSLTGTMAISERSLRDAEMLAIEEINKAGGVLGRPVRAIVEDAESKFTTTFPAKARKLLVQDNVAAVFGCWTSVSRKNVLPVFEENNGLLFYPVGYEGNEASRNVVYSGATPNQQILPAIDWLLSQQGGSKKRFYPLGTDYVFPRTANLIIVRYLASKGIKVIEEKYVPFGHDDFAAIVQDAKLKHADVIFSTINGESNVSFYNELAAQGVTADRVPVVSASVGEDELRDLEPSKVKDHLAAWNYFQSIDTPANNAFVKRFQDRYGRDRVTDDPIAAAYAQVYLWRSAVEMAGSTDVDKVRDAFVRNGPIGFGAPEGHIKIDPKNLHVYKAFRIGKIRGDRQFDVIYETPPIEPDPYPQVVFPGWEVDWTSYGLKKGQSIRFGR